jgi:hypothetical protein
MIMNDQVESFRNYLRDNSVQDTFRRFIMHQDCKVITEDQSYGLKNIVCENFSVGFEHVVIVGSCKLGFSIKPDKRFVPFGDESDIDVAIVSSGLFESVWKAAMDYKYSCADWPMKRQFFKYLSEGWIRPDKFPNDDAFPFGKEWWLFFNKITSSGNYGDYKIAAGIYYNSYFLEKYQTTCLEQCALELK